MARLDVALVENSMAKSRSMAQALIKGGQVFVCGKCVLKAGYEVSEGNLSQIEIRGKVNPFVSRGGLKLEKGIKSFNLNFGGKVVIDIGSSSGGFTDCVLRYGAVKVYAIDVGKGQFDNVLKEDGRIVLYEETDFRAIDNALISDAVIAVADVSFISLTKLIDKLATLNNLCELVLLIKPQFECGAELAKKYKGVIKNKGVHYKVLCNVLASFLGAGYACINLTYSPIKGGDGNIEYIAHFVKAKKLAGAEYKGNLGTVLGEGDNATVKHMGIVCKLEEVISSAFNALN